jgi:hypothetical protein
MHRRWSCSEHGDREVGNQCVEADAVARGFMSCTYLDETWLSV